MRKKLCLIFIILLAMIVAQASEKEDVWKPMKNLVGKWEGKGEGKSGNATVAKGFQFVLQGKFLQLKNKAVFEPQEANPKGEVHEDWGFFSSDRARKKIVFRQFHVEGFIIQYILDDISDDGKTLVFNSEQIENGPPGLKAKLTFKFVDNNTIEESFHLAFPGQDFSCYITNFLKRKK